MNEQTLRNTKFWILTVFMWAGSTGFLFAQGGLSLGGQAPMLGQGMEDVSGRSVSLEDAADQNGLLVIFSCNTCPWVARLEAQYNRLAMLANSNDIGMIVLNPNERIRQRGESIDDMKKRAQKLNYNFPYVVDRDHKVADAFGAAHTPEVFLFDANMRLVYHGAVSSTNNEGQNYTQEALQALINGTEIITKQTQVQGCSIKRTE